MPNQRNALIARQIRKTKYLFDFFECGVLPNDIAPPIRMKDLLQCLLCSCMPSIGLIPDQAQEFIDIHVGLRHHTKCVLIDNDIRTQQIQQCIQILIAILQWGCRQKDNSIRISAEQFHATVCPRIRISDRMCFINNHEIKVRHRIQIQKSPPFMSLA